MKELEIVLVTACVVGLTKLHMCVIVLEQSQVETMSWILSRLYFTIRCSAQLYLQSGFAGRMRPISVRARVMVLLDH